MWDIDFKIMEGFTGHFKTYTPKTIAKKGQNKTTTNPEENADILEKYFQNILTEKPT